MESCHINQSSFWAASTNCWLTSISPSTPIHSFCALLPILLLQKCFQDDVILVRVCTLAPGAVLTHHLCLQGAGTHPLPSLPPCLLPSLHPCLLTFLQSSMQVAQRKMNTVKGSIDDDLVTHIWWAAHNQLYVAYNCFSLLCTQGRETTVLSSALWQQRFQCQVSCFVSPRQLPLAICNT